MIGDVRFSYNKVDACPTDSQLYWKETLNDSDCATYGASIWQIVASETTSEPLR